MGQIGFHCSHELFSPRQLLGAVRHAERAGFTTAMCSDHYFPWGTRQGESGYTWSWLGAALEATNLAFGTVNAPGQRYHPAIIAQAAATLSQMYPERLWFAAGTGQFLNEHITGDPWPDKPTRRKRLVEAVTAMRRLWAGESVTCDGLVRMKDARLFSRPEKPPLVFGAAITEETAEWAGSWADGLITVAGEPDNLRKTAEAFRRGGGRGKPLYLQAAVSYAPTKQEAIDQAYRYWGVGTVSLDENQDTATPEEFDSLVAGHDKSEIEKALRVSADLSEHLGWIEQDFEIGFDRVYLHFIAPDLRPLIDTFAEQVLPKVK